MRRRRLQARGRHPVSPGRRGGGRGDDDLLASRFDARGLRHFVTSAPSESALWDAVDRVRAPTLVIRGQHSELLSRGVAEELAARFVGGRLREIPGGGHDRGVEQPAAVADAVLRFFAGGD